LELIERGSFSTVEVSGGGGGLVGFKKSCPTNPPPPWNITIKVNGFKIIKYFLHPLLVRFETHN